MIKKIDILIEELQRLKLELQLKSEYGEITTTFEFNLKTQIKKLMIELAKELTALP